MHIVISSGHGKYVPGAVGYIDEHEQAVRVVNRVGELLRSTETGVTTYEDTVSHSQNENLNRIVDFHNSKVRDLDVSVHFNAYSETSKPMGTECLYLTQTDLAAQVSRDIAEASGLINRGPKKRTDLFFLNNTEEAAILIEVCFVDSSADVELYENNFEAICIAIATAISGEEIGVPEPEPPPVASGRPVLRLGNVGSQVEVLQAALGFTPDGEFGPVTHQALCDFQQVNELEVDGICGDATWGALNAEYELPPYPPPLGGVLTQATLSQITATAAASPIASYSWRDRGRAPAGYTEGMAVAFADAYLRLLTDDPLIADIARANTGNESTDALAHYASQFSALGMDNSRPGADTLRHVFVLLLGLGMRESSGKHCEGRDMSADNVTADTAEAGLFQTSWNASGCTTDFLVCLDQYMPEPMFCSINTFRKGVSCSSSSWASYGTGTGRLYQDLAKGCPEFAVMTTALGLRRLRQHWGPINRYEVELKTDADRMFQDVQAIVDAIQPRPPIPPRPDSEMAIVRIEAAGPVRVTTVGDVRVFVNGEEMPPDA